MEYQQVTGYRYIVAKKDRVTIEVSRELHQALKIYARYKGLRSLTEALWRTVTIGIRYDLAGADPKDEKIMGLHRAMVKQFENIYGPLPGSLKYLPAWVRIREEAQQMRQKLEKERDAELAKHGMTDENDEEAGVGEGDGIEAASRDEETGTENC